MLRHGKRLSAAEIPTPSRLLPTVRQLLRGDADLRVDWIRENLRALMRASGHDGTAISALTGISVGTVRGFMRGTDSSIRNVILMSLALGVELDQIARPPEDFVRELRSRRDSGASSGQ